MEAETRPIRNTSVTLYGVRLARYKQDTQEIRTSLKFCLNGYPNLIDTGISRVLQMTKFAAFGILKKEARPMVIFDPSVIPRLL